MHKPDSTLNAAQDAGTLALDSDSSAVALVEPKHAAVSDAALAADDPLTYSLSDDHPVPTADMLEHAPMKLRAANVALVVLPLAGIVAAAVLLWGTAFNWVYLALLFVMYVITGLGITVGFHRLFTHRSFETSGFIRYLIGVAGSMAMQGPLMVWVGEHRRHHQHSDDHGDPHSPHGHGDTVMGMIRGAFHAHMGWMLRTPVEIDPKYVKDLLADPICVAVNKQFLMWVTLGMLIPAAIGGLVTMSWMGALLGLIWGGLVRTFVVHHITWSVNSICHIWGARPFNSHDYSRNNPIFGVLAFGEGWHNNHHAFPTSARHGLAWWQFDISYILIRGMEALGLAKRVRVPDAARIESKRRK